MRNDQQNQGNKPKQQAPGRQQEQERAAAKSGARVPDKDAKGKKAKSVPSHDNERNPGRSH